MNITSSIKKLFKSFVLVAALSGIAYASNAQPSNSKIDSNPSVKLTPEMPGGMGGTDTD